MGIELFEDEKFNAAIEEYEMALRLTPDNPKVLEARRRAEMAIAKSNVKQYSEQAIKMLNSGDAFSAENEIRKMLTTIPK